MTDSEPAVADPTYLLHGLRITSPVPIGAVSSDGTPDLHLKRHDGPPDAPGPVVLAAADDGPGRRRHVLSECAEGRAVLSLTGAASVAFRTGSARAELRTAPGVSDELLSVLVAGPVAVAAAALAGHAVLHASAVLLPEADGAVAFAGPSGSGKSSLARLLSGAGRHLLSDDALRIDPPPAGSQTVTVHRGTTGSRLRGRADELGRLVQTSGVGVAADGRHVLEDRRPPGPPTAPLRLVVLPRLTADVAAPRLSRVPGAAALPVLAAGSALDGLSAPSLLRRQFEAAAEVVRSVPVVELWLPWHPGVPLTASLQDDLRGMLVGVCGHASRRGERT